MFYSFSGAFRKDVEFSSLIEYYDDVDPVKHKVHFENLETYRQFETAFTVFELYFAADMVSEFITAYVDENNNLVKDLRKIRMRYLKNDFIMDFITLIPFTKLFHFSHSRFLFFIKCLRIIKAFKLLNVRKFNQNIRVIMKNNHTKICQDPNKANDRDTDYNHIIDQIIIKNAIKSIRLLVVTCICGWFFGIFFFVYSDIFALIEDSEISGTINF